MCGFAAIVGQGGVSSGDVWRMLAAIRHRGPDSAGVVSLGNGAPMLARSPDESTAAASVVLGLARLSIIDLSDAGFQPMSNESGRVWVAYNGEIYNFQALRAELESHGHRFASHADTEVLVHGWEEWEEGLFDRIEGMFAFCLHDLGSRRTLLVRDRLGVKPLYYAQREDGAWVAGSEIKALFAAGITAAMDPLGLDRFLTWLWVPDPDTAFEGVKKLLPGHVLEIASNGATKTWSYWDFVFEPEPGEHVEQLRSAIEASVGRQLVSDVPLGAFFSGGLDSTAIVEYMKREMAPRVPTCYTVGFTKRDLAYDVVGDDLGFARAYADRGGVRYREQILAPELADALPRVVWHMDEPVADPAALSAYQICKAAKAELTVMLSGVGGDELFGGYPRYLAAALARKYRALPAPLRRGARAFADHLPAAGSGRLARFGRNAQKMLQSADQSFPADYLAFLTYFNDDMRAGLYTSDFAAAVGTNGTGAVHREHLSRVSGEDWLHQAMYLDLKTFLPALNLTYMDKMSMAHSLEVRVPLLDERVVDVIRRVGPVGKLLRFERKPLFRRAMQGIVPDEIRSRRKAGFSAPVRGWLANELKPLVDDLLSSDTVRRRGMFEPRAVAELIAEFQTGRRDNALQIWQLLTLELWLQAFIDRPVA